MSEEDREPPIWRNTILWIGFLLLVVVAVLTVLVPELRSDPDDDQTVESSEDPEQP